MPNQLKALLARGTPAIGSWIGFTDPFAVEVMANAGFDWMIIDVEHSPIGRDSLRNILIAMKGGCTSVVRVPNNSAEYFKIALDLGAEGIMVPMLATPQDAAHAVAHCRYPPLGRRGFNPVRASEYYANIDAYVRGANSDIALIVQIETPEAVANLQEILAVDGIDAIFIGPADLSNFMGYKGQTSATEVQTVVNSTIDAAVRRRIPCGLPTWSVAECLDYIRRGVLLPTLGGDLHYLSSGARSEAGQIRARLQEELS